MGTCRTGITRRAERATRTRRGVIWSPGSRRPRPRPDPCPGPTARTCRGRVRRRLTARTAADVSPGTDAGPADPRPHPAPGEDGGPGGDSTGTQGPQERQEDADARTRGVEGGIRGFDDEGVRGAFDTDAMPGRTAPDVIQGARERRPAAHGTRARRIRARRAPPAARTGRRRRAFRPAPAAAAAQAGPGHQGRLGGAVRRAGLPGRGDRGGLVGTWYRRVLRGGRVRHRLRHTRAAYERTGTGRPGRRRRRRRV